MAEETNIGTAAQKPADNKNMKTCKSCGAAIAKNAKTCPGCGAKNKKPIYKKVWFWILIAVVVLCIGIGSSGSDDKPETAEPTKQSENNTAGAAEKKTEPTTQKQIEYIQVSFEKLIDDLKNNAYNAKQTWNGQYVEITGGVVENIDASGAYFSIASKSDKYFLDSIRVDISSDIRTEVMGSIASDAPVTVKGKISDVGELLGFVVDAQQVTVG